MVLTTFRAFWAVCALGLASACTYVPFDEHRTPSLSLSATQDHSLHPSVSQRLGAELSKTAYFELDNGTDALGARLRMIEAAETSIDIATFLVKPDTAGKLIANRLLAAADRGVKVRFLLDDVFTTADDTMLASLDAHPNIALRVFNPASRHAPKSMGFVFDFKRVNRRMHIKTFVVDSSMAIMGGRNYADEYYELKDSEAFADYDVLIFGPEAIELDQAFDTYWNDVYSVPMHALAPTEIATSKAMGQSLRYDITQDEINAYENAINSPYLEHIRTGKISPFWGRSTLIVDTPEKLRNKNGDGPHVLAETLFQEMRRSTNQVTLITPYFVPENYGARFFTDLVAQGLKVRVVTNSLASNNHAYVHGGYARHRKALLQGGVELFELRHDALEALGETIDDTPMPLTLHTKLAVLDQDRVFIGSLNLDPRSIKTNSEIGLFVHSPAYAKSLTRELHQGVERYAYRVTLDQNGDLVWTFTGHGKTERFSQDPNATFWQHVLAKMPIWFGLESLL